MQRVRRLLAKSSARREEGAFVLEGPKLLDEALASNAEIEEVLVRKGLRESTSAGRAPVYELDEGVIERIADTKTPQDVLAVVRREEPPLETLKGGRLAVVGVEITDPGNAGTMLRTAEVAGADGVVLCHGSVDVTNPKALRASAGALFHVPVATAGNAEDVLRQLGDWGYCRVGTVVEGGAAYHDLDVSQPIALILGNEAHGLPHVLDGEIDEHVTIPMVGRTESLNVGMAAAVLCFDIARRRATHE